MWFKAITFHQQRFFSQVWWIKNTYTIYGTDVYFFGHQIGHDDKNKVILYLRCITLPTGDEQNVFLGTFNVMFRNIEF